jgi:peptidoglycan hydrolase-like protein with peptidoglycan-binding domain
MSNEPMLVLGDEGEWVTYLQQLLEQAGYLDGADGVFGSTTEDAVRAYQEAAGLTADGVVGELTWAVLTGAGTEVAVSEGQDGEVPAELVAMGAPASLDEWTDEQKAGYFVGKEPIEEVGGDSPDEVEVLAMTESATDDEGVIA